MARAPHPAPHRMRHISLALPLLVGTTVAQNEFSAPDGYLGREGESAVAFTQPFRGAAGGQRYQYTYDAAALANVARANLQSVAFRRDAFATSTYPARTIDVEIHHAHGDAQAATATFGLNYLDVPTTVFARKPVNLPNHTPAPATAPAPWSATFPYDQPWSWDGTRDLVIELQTANPANPLGDSWSIDCVDARRAGVRPSYRYLDIHDNCTTPNGTFDIYAGTPVVHPNGDVSFGSYALRAAPNALAVLNIGSDQMLPNLLCATIRALPIYGSFPFTANAAGSIGDPANAEFLRLPFTGDTGFIAQYVCLDPTQPVVPVALSDAVLYEARQLGALDVVRVSSNTSDTAATGIVSGFFVPVLRFRN